MHLRRRTAAGKNETRSVPVMLWNNIESEKKNRHSSERTTEVIQFSTLQSAISTLLEIWSNH